MHFVVYFPFLQPTSMLGNSYDGMSNDNKAVGDKLGNNQRKGIQTHPDGKLVILHCILLSFYLHFTFELLNPSPQITYVIIE